MIKDRAQKRMAAKFCAAQKVVPFAEVIVRSSAGLEETPVDITDIDILGIEYGRRGIERRTIFDCKTGKMSPINRAMWVSGVKSYTHSDEAFLIMRKGAPYSHRLAANEMNIHIHSEENFEKFAASVSPEYSYDCTYLDNMDVWEKIPTIPAGNDRLTDLVTFCTNTAATERSGAKGLRSALSSLLRSSPELDPRKNNHIFLYALALSGFSGFCATTAVDLKNVFQFDMDKAEFDKIIRYYIWGGRESYQMRRSLKASLESTNSTSNVDLELPDWSKFLNMFRGFLDAPELLSIVPYVTKEIAFRIASTPRPEPDARILSLISSNNRARQFIFSINSYFVSAGRLPKEMQGAYEGIVNSILAPSTIQPQAAVKAPNLLI